MGGGDKTAKREGKDVRFPMRAKRGFATVTIYRRKHPKTASGFNYTVAWTIGGHRYTLQRADFKKAWIEAVMKAEQLSTGNTPRPDRGLSAATSWP